MLMAKFSPKRALAPLLPVLTLLSACASAVPPVTTATPALVTLNPDGTISVGKKASGESSENAGLVIPDQIIVPIVRTKEKSSDGTAPF
jgi:hypothetical protein